jgi:proteasome assembly chaperone (PAC2) family protein
MHHLMRPEIKLVDGYRERLSEHRNEVYEATIGDKPLYILTGEEPQLAEDRYAKVFFDLVEALKVKRVVAVAGVYGPVPYNKEREVSCVYSLPEMKAELSKLALTFSNYEGAATLGTYLAHKAEARGIEYVTMYAFVPAYDLPALAPRFMRIEQDYRAWHGVLRRLAYMAGLSIDLADLEARSRELTAGWETEIETVARERPDVPIRAYLQAIEGGFVERPFMPLDDAWDELSDVLKGMDS